MKGKLCVLTVVLVLAPMTAVADICEDVNDISNGWNELANAIDEMDLAALTEADAETIDAGIEEAYDSTETFANLLEDDGNAKEARLGRNLNAALDDLYDTQDSGIDEIVDAMDSVVDVLDEIVDFCDQH